MTQNNTNPNVEPAPAKASNPAGNAGNPAEEARATGDTQMPVEPSKLDNLRGMMAERHPDANYASDDDFYAAIADDYTARDKELGEYKDREKRISDLFSKDARSAKFMTNWMDGNDPLVALIREYGDDLRTALDDPEKAEEIAAANEEWAKTLAKETEMDEEYEKNLNESLAALEAYEAEKGISPEQTDAAIAKLRQQASDIIMGKFTPEMVEAVLKAQNYDNDIANAEHEAEVRGKNTRAEMQLRKPKSSDGMPNLGSRSGGDAPKRPQIAGALGREKRSIWDVGGGMKRTSRS